LSDIEKLREDLERHEKYIGNLSHNLSQLYRKVAVLEGADIWSFPAKTLKPAEPKEKPTLDSCVDRLRVLYTRMPRALALEMLNIIYDLDMLEFRNNHD
jgi:hypothetical protein